MFIDQSALRNTSPFQGRHWIFDSNNFALKGAFLYS